MAFSIPYRTDHYVAFPADTVISRLSIAFKLVDGLTKNGPLGSVRVEIKETGKKAIKNPGGYYLFTDLKGGSHTVSIDSDMYFPEVAAADISPLTEPEDQVTEIVLVPRPVYPFSQDATLIRGVVRDAAGTPVKDARLRVMDTNAQTISDEHGSFVFYLSGVATEKEMIIEIKKNGNTRTVNILAKEFQTVSAGVISLP